MQLPEVFLDPEISKSFIEKLDPPPKVPSEEEILSERFVAHVQLETYLLGIYENQLRDAYRLSLPNHLNITAALVGQYVESIPSFDSLRTTSNILQNLFRIEFNENIPQLSHELLLPQRPLPLLRKGPLTQIDRFLTKFRDISSEEFPFILKLDSSGSNLHDFLVRVWTLNTLRRYIPTFSYSLACFECSNSVVGSSEIMCWCEDSETAMPDYSQYYVLEENFHPTTNLSQYFLQMAPGTQVDDNFIHLLLQMASAIGLANQRFGYVNYGINLENVFVSSRRSFLSIPLFFPPVLEKILIQTKTLLTITGSGQEKVRLYNTSSSRVITLAGDSYYNQAASSADKPHYDLYLLLTQMKKVANPSFSQLINSLLENARWSQGYQKVDAANSIIAYLTENYSSCYAVDSRENEIFKEESLQDHLQKTEPTSNIEYLILQKGKSSPKIKYDFAAGFAGDRLLLSETIPREFDSFMNDEKWKKVTSSQEAINVLQEIYQLAASLSHYSNVFQTATETADILKRENEKVFLAVRGIWYLEASQKLLAVIEEVSVFKRLTGDSAKEEELLQYLLASLEGLKERISLRN